MLNWSFFGGSSSLEDVVPQFFEVFPGDLSSAPMASKSYSPWYTEVHMIDAEKKKTEMVQCMLCKNTFAKRIERMLSHLGYDKVLGLRTSGVGRCTNLSPAILSLFKTCGGKFPNDSRIFMSEQSTSPVTRGNISPRVNTPMDVDSCAGSRVSTPKNEPVLIGEGVPFISTFPGEGSGPFPPLKAKRQSTLQEGFEETQRRECDKAWATCFYENSISFNVARSASFKDAVLKTSNMKRSYTPPSYHHLRTNLLAQARTDLETSLNDRIFSSVRKYGGTLALDGWTSVSSRPLINAMLVSPAGELFLGAVDTSGKEKDAVFVATVIEKFIQQVGEQNIIQVCYDNAPVMLNAGKLVQALYPSIFVQGCAAHAMDLLLEDWSKMKWVKELLDRAKNLVKFIKIRQMPLSVFRKHEAKLSLLMPGQTRFASHYIMISRLLKVRGALEQSVVDPDWRNYETKKTLSARDKAKISRDVKRVVLDDVFWEQCANFKWMTSPVVYALREFDAKESALGKAYVVLRNLEKHVLSLRHEPFKLDSDNADYCEDSFYERKAMIKSPLQCAAALLNPYLIDDEDLHNDTDAMASAKEVLLSMAPPTLKEVVIEEFFAFREAYPPFRDVRESSKSQLPPSGWWDIYGSAGKFISPIAKRILAQPLSSSSCERNWSSYSFVHDRKRNRLLPERANDLVFVYTNSKIISQSKLSALGRFYGELEGKEDPKAVETEDVDYSSESDVDLPFDDLSIDPPIEAPVDDLEVSPKGKSRCSPAPMERAFEYDDVEEEGTNEEDTIPLSSFLNGDGLLNSDKILRGGSSHTTVDLVIPKKEGDPTIDTSKVVSPNFNRLKDDMVPPTTKEDVPVPVSGASRTLFGTAKTRVQVGGFESSTRLVELSKKMKADAKAAEVAEKCRKRLVRTRQADPGLLSTDDGLPIGNLFGPKLALGKPDIFPEKPPARATSKRKAVDKTQKVLAFNPGRPKTPLDDPNGPKKFLNPFESKKKSKARVKKVRESDGDDEYDSSGPSGAEVKDDSDYVA